MSEDAALAGRTALVTGAGRGAGREIALRLARSGAQVALAARSTGALESTRAQIESGGGRALVVPTDLRDPEQVVRAVAATVEGLGALDVLVSNSGVAGPTAELWRVDPADWEETFRVNVTGTFLLCRAALPAMLARRAGCVVVIGSATGKRPLPGRTPYAASKTALIGLVRTLAAEAGPYGVRVNLVSPGPIEGERLDGVIARQAEARDEPLEKVRAEFFDAAPLRRATPPGDVADAVAFLAGDGARSITGEDLNVSAGWVMH